MLIVSSFGAFFSPFIYQPNVGVTQNEIAGMNWLFQVKGDAIITDILNAQTGYRFGDFFFGWEENNRRTDTKNYKFPFHFGYDKSTLFDYRNIYIIIKGWDEHFFEEAAVYEKNQEKYVRFTRDDFKKFRNDLNINKIYHSKNIEIFKS
jgi:hypothetical protein